MARGRHASTGTTGFYRDLGIMVLGILLVGAVVFLILYLLVDDDPPEALTTTTTTEGSSSTTSDGETSTTVAVTSTTAAQSTTTTVPVRPPSEVTVAVLNSVGLPGAAGAMTSVLAEAGYQTQQAADYEPLQDPSRIWYREGFSAEANVMLQFLPDAMVEPLPDDELKPGADVVMVLGSDYEG
jgi:hypothetical protein